ncbi:MAG TPA: PBP1A family penicillin-binding protein [Methylomirabilota bacterium]|nr:PBP1A family penicillin-binding protein [Methylomirabilota bacterium]
MTRRQPSIRIEPTLGDGKGDRGLRAGPGDRAHPDAVLREKRPAPRKTGAGESAKSARSTGGGASRREPRRRRRTGVLGFIRGSIYWGLVLSLWGLIGLAGVIGYTVATMPQTSEWVVPKRPPNVEIVDASGRLIANRGDTGGEAVRLQDLPAHVPQAVIAIEDRRFYSHFGLDPIGLARAMATNARTGDFVQGGSTLTQQLAKNLFLTPARTLERKLQEAVLALWLEWRYSKDEILEMYLNRVYLGGGAYGVDGAARRYYARGASELTLRQAAVLAGLLKAPSRLFPATNPRQADERARVVLAAMVEQGFIDRAAADRAMAEPAGTVTEHRTKAGNYVADWVMELLPGYIASIEGDVVVETTIDVDMQIAAEAAIRDILAAEGAAHGVTQGALVAIDGDGAVKALVGGRDYGESQFNRAIDAHRQPGSAFKPFVYLAAVERGYRPEQVVVDEPITINGWSPQNYTRTFEGPVTLTTALAKSLNTVSARLAANVGPSLVADTARRVGIVSRLHENPSIALGTAEVTPLELTAAYVPFSNGGEGVIPFVVDRIATVDGRTLFQRRGGRVGQVIEPAVVGTMNRMLQQVLEIGTGQKAVLPGRPAGGKTGTSQEFRDAWFLGYVTGLTAGVWLGNDDNSPTKRATGGSLTALVWNRFMTAATSGTPVAALPGVELMLPTVGDTSVAEGDGLPALGPTGPVISRPAREIPLTGPTDAERGLLERLFGG